MTRFPAAMLVFLVPFLSVRNVLAHGISAADQQNMIDGGYAKFVELGASHMLTGYDHLLFLFGVVFFLDKFRDITKFITAFTLGHSITLVFATFMGISANYYLIDAAIALTVVYKGFDNLGGFQKFFRMASPNLLGLVFIFGLVHGFGLSTRLQLLPLGESGLLLKILSFNLGVELGQIAALTVMLFLLRAWRGMKSFERFSTASNLGLVAAGLLLCGYQLGGYAGAFGDEPEAEHAAAAGEGVSALVDWTDVNEVTIPANGSLEFKFKLEKGEPLKYAWQTDGTALFFDFHGDPTGAKPDEFESFEVATLSRSEGSLTPPFSGAIGWWWKNETDKDVVVTLRTLGEYEVIGIP